jgi:formate--tetrahydrofolate ligase
MLSDIEIASAASIQLIQQIADKLAIDKDLLIPYGKYKAKLPLELINAEKQKKAKLVLVSAISPTPAGEGKTTTSIGLTEGLNYIGKKAIAVLREPSLGPVFGIKGGAAGGGYAQVIPMEEINLHFNGDFSAIEKANNLLAALIDNAIQAKNPLVHIDPRTVRWKRVMDMNDRSLRNIIVALGGKANGFPRETGFDITAASEVMAILCMSESLSELKQRLGNIYIGKSFSGEPVFARHLKAEGAMAALLKEAIMPNLVQTLEGNPAILHGGPFANIAQGTNTILATKMGMSLADIVVTEAGFAFDLGGEKFLDIKCRKAGVFPDAIVLVATLRALKYHGGADSKKLQEEDLDSLKKGFANLKRHAENVRKFGVTPLISVNSFATDTEAEQKLISELCAIEKLEISFCTAWANGGKGAADLAKKLCNILENSSTKPHFLYDLNESPKEKINKLAVNFYGAAEVQYSAKAESDLREIAKLGLDNLPICMAKTQYSFSDNPKLLGSPINFPFVIREVEIAAGAGFIIPIAGDMMRMPGLPNNPASENIDIDDDGNIRGLF